jgi:hypothetical protein
MAVHTTSRKLLENRARPVSVGLGSLCFREWNQGMDSGTLIKPYSQVNAPVVELLCDLCKLPRSRRHALVAIVGDTSKFLCEACCRETGSGPYSDPFGWGDFWLLYVALRGGAA